MFPELSSRYLGQMTLDTLNDTAKTLGVAGSHFVKSKRVVDKNSANTVERIIDAPLIGPTVMTTDEEHALSQNKVTSLPNTPSYIKAKNIIHLFISASPTSLNTTTLASNTECDWLDKYQSENTEEALKLQSRSTGVQF